MILVIILQIKVGLHVLCEFQMLPMLSQNLTLQKAFEAVVQINVELKITELF